MTHRNNILAIIVGVIALAIIAGALFVHRPSPAVAPTQAAPSAPQSSHVAKPFRQKKHSEAKKIRQPESKPKRADRKPEHRREHSNRHDERSRREQHERRKNRHGDVAAVHTQLGDEAILGHTCTEVRWGKANLSQDKIDYFAKQATKAQRRAGSNCLYRW